MVARGTVVAARAGIVEVRLPGTRVGEDVSILTSPVSTAGCVCAIAGGNCFVTPYGSLDGIAPGMRVQTAPGAGKLALGTCALGRAIDARGLPLDRGTNLQGRKMPVRMDAITPAQRTAVTQPFWTGVRVLDGLLTFGHGARIGIFGPPGAGKSVLVESIVASCGADAIVIGLIGERGREAQRWIERRDARTTIVCATSDRPAAERVRAAQVAAAQACALRERGLRVLFVLDSLARVAAALRERALAMGESTGRAGYPPSVFGDLAALVETAGRSQAGSTTLIATVLDDGDDRDPVSDAARSLLDGHVQLCSHLAEAGRFPAVDVLRSASRTMAHVCSDAHVMHAQVVRSALALLHRCEDARRLGIEPQDPSSRAVFALEERLHAFLRQSPVRLDPNSMLAALADLADTLEEPHGH